MLMLRGQFSHKVHVTLLVVRRWPHYPLVINTQLAVGIYLLEGRTEFYLQHRSKQSRNICLLMRLIHSLYFLER